MLTPFRVTPLPDERVWGGTRLGPPRKLPIGELWLVGPSLVVGDGPHAGRTLEDVAGELGAALVGSAAPVRPGPRFPLIVKLLDPAAWLSVQVHPNDATARPPGRARCGRQDRGLVRARRRPRRRAAPGRPPRRAPGRPGDRDARRRRNDRASRAPCRGRRRRAPGRGRDAPRRRTRPVPVRAPAAVGHHVPRRRLGAARLPHAAAPHEAGARVRHSPEPADAPRHGQRRARPCLPALHARRLRRAHAARPGGPHGADRDGRWRGRRAGRRGLGRAPGAARNDRRSRRQPDRGSCALAPAGVHWWPRCRRRRSGPAPRRPRAIVHTPRRCGRDSANPAILRRTEGILATARDRNRRFAAPAGPSCRTPSDPVGAASLTERRTSRPSATPQHTWPCIRAAASSCRAGDQPTAIAESPRCPGRREHSAPVPAPSGARGGHARRPRHRHDPAARPRRRGDADRAARRRAARRRGPHAHAHADPHARRVAHRRRPSPANPRPRQRRPQRPRPPPRRPPPPPRASAPGPRPRPTA